MAGALREIIAHFGFDFDEHKLDHADKKIGHVKEHAEHGAAGVDLLVEAFQAFAALEVVNIAKEWVEGLVETATGLQHASEATGVSTDELQEWQLGAAEAGVSSEEFTMSLRRLSTALAGGKNEAGSQAAVFAHLGIKTKDAAGHARTLSAVLPEIADHFAETKDGASKAALAQELFGRQGARLIPLLNKGAEGLDELHREFEDLGGGFRPEMIERAEEFHQSMARLKVATDGLKSLIGVYLLPYLTDLIEQFGEGVATFRNWAKETTLLESGIRTLAKAIGFALWGALSPFLFGALKFAAIFLAFDDLNGFLAGEDSLIGRFLDAAFGEGKATVVREWIQDATEWFTSGFDAMGLVVGALESDVIVYFSQIAAWIAHTCDQIAETWNDTIGSLHLPDALKVDRARTVGRDVAANANVVAQQNTQKILHDNVDKFNAASTPTTGQITAGPVAHNVEYHNSVELNPEIHITVAAGADEHTTIRNVKKATNEAMREQRRAALQALENRAPGGG